MPACVQVCVHVCQCVLYMYVPVEARSQHLIFLLLLSTSFSKLRSLAEAGALWLPGLAGPQAPGICLFPLHGAGVAGVCWNSQVFLWIMGIPNILRSSYLHSRWLINWAVPSDNICILHETSHVLKDIWLENRRQNIMFQIHTLLKCRYACWQVLFDTLKNRLQIFQARWLQHTLAMNFLCHLSTQEHFCQKK